MASAPASETTPLVRNNGSSIADDSERRRNWGRVVLGTVGLLLLLGVAFYGGTRLSASSSGTSSSESPPQLVVAPSKKNVKKDDGTPRYGATQFLSFTINTLGGLEEHGECKHRPVDSSTRSCYLGNANITEDILHRLDIVEQVLHRIKEDAFAESPDIDHADDVLKIFMMPEFFWRGPYGAYSTELLLDQSSIGNQVIRRLRDMIADDFFGDFLFVFGTTITAQKSSPNKNTTERIPKSATDINYFNWAAVYKGGSNHKHYYAVTKKYISGADFLSRTTLPNPKEEQVDAYSAVDDALKEAFVTRGTELITNNVLEMDGLRIGVEICLDHRVGTLWNYLKTNREPLVDVLLVTSAGMAIERGPNPIVPGGVVYLSDGEASSAACMRTDDPADHYAFYPQAVCRSQPGGLKHIPIGGPGYSGFFALSACWDIENIDLLRGYYSLYQTQGCAYTLSTYDINVMDEFTYYPPSIEIYPTVALPVNAYDDD